MTLTEIIAACTILLLFSAGLAQSVPALLSLSATVSTAQVDNATAAFLSETFRKACAANRAAIDTWKTTASAQPSVSEVTITVEKTKSTCTLYRAECVISDHTYVFKGTVLQ